MGTRAVMSYWSWAEWGIYTPAFPHATITSPEQSYVAGPAPPHWYGLPIWRFGKSQCRCPPTGGRYGGRTPDAAGVEVRGRRGGQGSGSGTALVGYSQKVAQASLGRRPRGRPKSSRPGCTGAVVVALAVV